MSRDSIRVHIRWMIRSDMQEVLQIEQGSFEHYWTEEDFMNCLRQRNCIGMVAEIGEQVVGFMIYELFKTRLNVLNFAVHPQFRRMGIGEQMMNRMISKLSTNYRTRIVLNVRDSNLPAQLFFREQGFKAVYVHRNMFCDFGEDGYEMRYRIASQPEDSCPEIPSHIEDFVDPSF